MTAAAVVASTGGAVMASAASAATLSGAGSTLVAPLEAYWAQGWGAQSGNSVTYQAVGSGTGINDIISNSVDFAGSDAPLNANQAANCSQCLEIPWALSATGIGYNIAGVPNGKLKLTPTLLAEIYLGQITNWNNPAIQAVNKGVTLPNLTITPIYRSDGSGDSYVFSAELSAVNSTWAQQVGTGTQPQFKAGTGAKGNLGVTTLLQNTNGGIAYIGVAYLLAHNVNVAAIQNNAGKFVYPNLTNISAAAAVVKNPQPNQGISIINPPKSNKKAYPLSTFTYVIVHTNASQGSLLQGFITYALGAGQKYGPSLDFAPMPAGVKKLATSEIGQIQ